MRPTIRVFVMLITLLAMLTATVPAALADSQVHLVQPGETLFRISLRYGISIQAIQAANGISGTRIYSGQRLIIPDPNAPAPPPAQSSQSGGVHVVQPGETLFRIGLKYNLPWMAIQAANGLAGTTVYSGQQLLIPGAAAAPALVPEPPPAEPAVQAQPEQAVQVQPEQPAQVQPEQAVQVQPEQPPAEAPAQPAVEQGGQRVHIVQRGETLFLIGLKYGLTWTAIRAANNLPGDKIYTGQRLAIPEKGAAPAPAPEQPAEQVVEVAAPAGDGKRFLVDLSEQRLYAFEGDTLVRTTLISSGLPQYPTVTGTFHVYLRYTSARMRGPGYDLANVPYVMYFFKGYGLHGTYWHSNFGHPMSHGCVNMPTSEAEWAYNWSDFGTTVIVQP